MVQSISLNVFLQQITQDLKQGGIENPRSQARLIIANVLGCSLEHLVLYPDKLIDLSQQYRVHELVKRCLNHEPLSRIFGYREFWSLPFFLNEETLDPRPDSEILIEAVLQYYPDKNASLNILDLGTGTGCLLLSLLSEYKNAKGMGTDIQPKAVEAAQKNASGLELESRATFINTSWAEGASGFFDIIISNPPYITDPEYKKLDPNVRNYDPRISLVGGEDGLQCYQELSKIVPSLLNPQGILVLEIGKGQKQEVQDIFKKESLELISTHQDLAGIDRALVLRKKEV